MYKIEKYTDDMEQMWDDFVLNMSSNGTFLQTRRFMNYHPRGRFRDCSLLFYNQKGQLASVCPANMIDESGIKTFFSFKGATFGGLVIAEKFYKAKYVIELVRELKEYLAEIGYSKIYLKTTPEIFSKRGSSLLEYACYYNGFVEYKELNPYISYERYNDDIISNLSQGKRTHVHKCEKEGLYVKSIYSDTDIEKYYEILCENLRKYDLLPVHTLNELLEFKNSRLKKECEFFGVYLKEEMVAGGMLFYFEQAKIAHTQYLSTRQDYLTLSPMSYLYYWLIKEMKRRGYKALSWGICTERHGTVINQGLIGSKEDFGSTYSNNYTYYFNLKIGRI